MDTNTKVIMAYAIIAIGPIVGSYMVVKNSSKLTGAMFGALNKAGKGLSKMATKWAKERYEGSQFKQARNYRKAVKDSERIERHGQMTGDSATARYNRLMSRVAGSKYAKGYQTSATNKAAAYSDKIFREDQENAAAEFARNGIQGPLMVAHARSGRVARYNEETGELEYGRELTEAEHAAAIAWTMSQGKLEERMDLYGSDWASTRRNDKNRRALDTLTAGYFQKDVSRFGNSFGGRLGAGLAGGDVGVSNAILSNMAQGKTAPEALLDNDMAQRLADIGSMSDTDLINHINSTESLRALATAGGGTVEEFVGKFRANAKDVTQGIYDTPDLNSRIKPEFAEALKEVNQGVYASSRRTNKTVKAAAAAGIPVRPPGTLNIVAGFDAIGQKPTPPSP